MKFYKHKDETNHAVTNILLETKEEVLLFLQNKDIFWEQDIDNYIKMTMIDDKSTRDRLIGHTSFRSPIAEVAKRFSSLFDYVTNFSPSSFAIQYNDGMISTFERHSNIFVNRKGGYCFFGAFNKDDYTEVFGFNIEDLMNDCSYSFNYFNSEKNVLVLENDPVLDSWTTEYFELPVPYICNLRTIMKTNKFEELLKEYIKRNKSTKLFVYTTGLDYDQMLEYTERAIACGFTEFEWVFNGFTREYEFVKFLNSKSIKYKISHI